MPVVITTYCAAISIHVVCYPYSCWPEIFIIVVFIATTVHDTPVTDKWHGINYIYLKLIILIQHS